jgi:protein O-GlcNAc transferase
MGRHMSCPLLPLSLTNHQMPRHYVPCSNEREVHLELPIVTTSQTVSIMGHPYVDQHHIPPAYAIAMPHYKEQCGIADHPVASQIHWKSSEDILHTVKSSELFITYVSDYLLKDESESPPKHAMTQILTASSGSHTVVSSNMVVPEYSLSQHPEISKKDAVASLLHLAYEKYNVMLYEDAYSLCLQIWEMESSHLSNLLLLGCICFKRGLYEDSLRYNYNLLKLDPMFAEAYSNLGTIYCIFGNYDIAMLYYRYAINIKPHFWDAYDNMASLCLQYSGCHILNLLDSSSEDMVKYKYELRINAYQTLAKMFQDENNIRGAMNTYFSALRSNPNPNCCNNLGILLSQTGRLDEAILYYYHGLKLESKHVHLLTNLGSAYKEKGLISEAIQCYLRALEVDSKFHIALINLASLYKDIGRTCQAIEQYKQVLELIPNAPDALCNYAHARLSICDWTDREMNLKDIHTIVMKQLAANEVPSVLPFHCFIYPFDEKDIKLISMKHAEKAAKTMSISFTHSLTQRQSSGERLRVGYVSSDFGNHPLSHLMQSVFGMHDRMGFEIFCYATSADDGSTYRQKIKTESEHFIEIMALSNEEAAKQIYKDRIHILVNLNGYTKGARNEIFAAHPAPIQVSFMGFPGTMGAPFIHYLISDKIATPPDLAADFFTEQLVFMPQSYFVTDHRQSFRTIFNKDLLPTRAQVFPNLTQETIIFANFNQVYKIDPFIFNSWMTILKSVPNSVLWLLRFPPPAEPNLLQEAERRGVSRNRILFTDVAPKEDYILKSTIADIFLDTPECNGHTTAADVLWAGVPVITYPKRKMASRVCASLCEATGFGKYMITYSYSEYEHKAIQLATDSHLRHYLRHELETSRDTNILFDTRQWVHYLEVAYLKMWDNFERGIVSPIYVECD